MKFPNSLFADLIENNVGLTSGERIKIDRDPKHFVTVLNLMRTQKKTYAAGLSNNDLDELLDELKYYRLPSLAQLVAELIQPSHQMEHIATRIMLHQGQYIENIERPTVAISSRTASDFSKSSSIDKLINVFDHRYYDVIILGGPFEGHPFNEIIPTESKRRSFKSGNLRLCLYLPGEPEPYLKVVKSYSSPHEFNAILNKFLLALDLFRRDPSSGEVVKSSLPEWLSSELILADSDDWGWAN